MFIRVKNKPKFWSTGVFSNLAEYEWQDTGSDFLHFDKKWDGMRDCFCKRVCEGCGSTEKKFFLNVLKRTEWWLSEVF